MENEDNELEDKLEEQENRPENVKKLDAEVHGASIISDEKGGAHIIPIEIEDDDTRVFLNTYSVYVDSFSFNGTEVADFSGNIKLENSEGIDIFVVQDEESTQAMLEI